MFRKVLVFGIILLFVGVNILSFVSSRENVEKQTSTALVTNNIYIVDDEGDGNFTNIQDAIDNASIGDFIYVHSGNYSGNVVINKSLNILGIDYEYLNGSDTGNPVIWGGGALIDHASQVVFSNFSLGGIPDIDKIKLEYTNDSYIFNCKADYLLLYSADKITVSNCEFKTNLDNFASISLVLSSNNTITDNICTGGASEVNYNVGICLQSSNDNLLLNNTCIAEDSVNTKGIDPAMYIVSSTGNNISGNICLQSDIGIKLEFANNNYVYKNNITDNSDTGAYLIKSNYNEIIQNNFINNPQQATFKKCKGTTWNENYWDDLTFTPKLIFGKTGPLLGLIPWVNIDWRPANQPYNIG